MIELWIRPNRLPTGVGVATRAGCGDRAMGIGHLGLRHAYTRTYTGTPGGTPGGTASGTATRITTRVSTGFGAGVRSGIDGGTRAGNDAARGRPQSHAAEHGRQPKSNGNKPACPVHRSLRVIGLHKSIRTKSEADRAQKPTTARASCAMARTCLSSTSDELCELVQCERTTFRGRKNQIVRILVCRNCHTRPMKR